jgi:hypothetical protein
MVMRIQWALVLAVLLVAPIQAQSQATGPAQTQDASDESGGSAGPPAASDAESSQENSIVCDLLVQLGLGCAGKADAEFGAGDGPDQCSTGAQCATAPIIWWPWGELPTEYGEGYVWVCVDIWGTRC